MVTTDARSLVVLGGVAGKLEELSGQVASAQVGARYSGLPPISPGRIQPVSYEFSQNHRVGEVGELKVRFGKNQI